MSSDLTILDFEAFFRAANGGNDPFDWQTRLAREASDRHGWPTLFDLPTGAGKTSIIDVALFLLALDAQVAPADRWTPRRIAMVVDRRVVVDQAFRHAQMIQTLLREPDDGILREVATRLRSLVSHPTHGDQVIEVGQLRGGVTIEETWSRTPDRPAVLASTVDQVGSRLLFQGYGVSRFMRPIHAGLLANDTLILLDEVHLATPFAETLRAVRTRYRGWATTSSTSPWFVSELSATPLQKGDTPPVGEWIFSLSPDTASAEAETAPVLRQRLAATKPARLVAVKTAMRDAEKARTATAKAATAEANRLLSEPHIHHVAVVVNRVDTARQAATLLNATVGDVCDIVLLTGRMRAFERDPLVARLADRLATRTTLGDGRSRELIVVATQCIEAGADLDFDGLVTECASLDALRQRFGRVDRGGVLAAVGTPTNAVILGPDQLVDGRAETDPVYGDAAKATWAWLQASSTEGVVDFGITLLPDRTREEAQDVAPPQRAAPLLLPAHLDAWVATPMGGDDIVPDVARWLHGDVDAPADVHLVWRAELGGAFLDAASKPGSEAERALGDILSFCPPSTAETVAVPIHAVRSWLRGGEPEPIADVEVQVLAEEEWSPQRAVARRSFATWDGAVARATSDPSRLRPGSVVVVPSIYGGLATRSFEGLSAGSWDPRATGPVADLGDADAPLAARRRHVLRLLPPEMIGAKARGTVPDPAARLPDETVAQHVQPWLDSWLQETGFTHAGKPLVREFAVEDGARKSSWYAIELRGGRLAATTDTDPATSAFTGVDAYLDEHLVGVGERAAAFAAVCGLDQPMTRDLALSGELHDLGKVDPRFQAWLRDGHQPVEGDRLLAKSTTVGFDRSAVRAARQRSSYPQGLRHELLSLALVENGSIERSATDWDLVRHLVASHHGWCRPFAPLALDMDPLDATADHQGVRLEATTGHGLERGDSGVSDRYWDLVRRYGWFHLAWLESLLRLADHRRSQYEQERKAS